MFHSRDAVSCASPFGVVIAIVGSIGLDIADPLIGLAITLLILRITWHSWQTISAAG